MHFFTAGHWTVTIIIKNNINKIKRILRVSGEKIYLFHLITAHGMKFDIDKKKIIIFSVLFDISKQVLGRRLEIQHF